MTPDKTLKTLQDIVKRVWNLDVSDPSFVAILNVNLVSLQELHKNSSTFQVTGVTFKRRLLFVINNLQSVINSIKTKSVLRSKYKRLYQDWLKAIWLLSKDTFDRLESLKPFVVQQSEQGAETDSETMEPITETVPDNPPPVMVPEAPVVEHASSKDEPVVTLNSLAGLTALKGRIKTFSQKATQTQETKSVEAAIPPMGGDPQRKGEALIDKALLDAEKESDKNQKQFNSKITHIIDQQLKKFSGIRSNIPMLGSSGFQVFVTTLFVPGFIPDNVLSKLSFKTERIEGGNLFYGQSVLMSVRGVDVSSTVKKISNSSPVKYADGLDGRFIISKHKANFTWLVKQQDLSKLSSFFPEPRFPWDVVLKSASKIPEDALKRTRQEIEDKINQKYAQSLKTIEEYEDNISELTAKVNSKLKEIELIKLRIRDNLRTSKSPTKLETEIKKIKGEVESMNLEKMFMKKEIKEAKEKYEADLEAERAKALKSLRG